MPLELEMAAELIRAGRDVWALSDKGLLDLHAKFLAHRKGSPAEKAAAGSLPRVAGTVAVLPLYGVIGNNAADYYADTTTDAFGSLFSAAVRSDAIKAIVVNCDSPGGSVYGVSELAQKMFEARGSKPICAVANCLAASAGYWIASACEQMTCTPSGDVGSIGVFSMHQDYSKMFSGAGVSTEFIKAGKYKTEGNPYEPLDDEARQSMQTRVDGFYSDFVGAVAKHRGRSPSVVKSDFGEGRIVRAKDAATAGMVDRVATLDKVLGELGVGGRVSARDKAADDEATAILCEAAGMIVVATEATVDPDYSHGDPDALRRKLKLKVG